MDIHNQLKTDAPWGAWNVGASERVLNDLWKRYRQAAAKQTLEDDERAKLIMDQIADKIDEASSDRLKVWKEKVATRAGAARWVKHKTFAASKARIR